MSDAPKRDHRDEEASKILEHRGETLRILKVVKAGVTTSVVKASIENGERIVLVSPTHEILNKTLREVTRILVEQGTIQSGEELNVIQVFPNLGNISLEPTQEDYQIDRKELAKSLCTIKTDEVIADEEKFLIYKQSKNEKKYDRLKKLHHLKPMPKTCAQCDRDCHLNRILAKIEGDKPVQLILITHKKLQALLNISNVKLRKVLDFIVESDTILLDEFSQAITETSHPTKVNTRKGSFDKDDSIADEFVECFFNEIGMILDDDVQKNEVIGKSHKKKKNHKEEASKVEAFWYYVGNLLRHLRNIDSRKENLAKTLIEDEKQTAYDEGIAYLVDIIPQTIKPKFRRDFSNTHVEYELYKHYHKKGKNVELIREALNLLIYSYLLVERKDKTVTIRGIDIGQRDYIANLQKRISGTTRLLLVDSGTPSFFEYVPKHKPVRDYEVKDTLRTQSSLLIVVDDISLKADMSFIKKKGRQEEVIGFINEWAKLHPEGKPAIITTSGYTEVESGGKPYKIAQIVDMWLKKGRIPRRFKPAYHYRDIFNRGTEFPESKESVISIGLPYPPTNSFLPNAIVMNWLERIELPRKYGSSRLFKEYLKGSRTERLELIPAFNKAHFADSVSSTFNNYIHRNKDPLGKKLAVNYCLISKKENVIACLKNGYPEFPLPHIISCYAEGGFYRGEALICGELFKKYYRALGDQLVQDLPLLARIIRIAREKRQVKLRDLQKNRGSEIEKDTIRETLRNAQYRELLSNELGTKFNRLKIRT